MGLETGTYISDLVATNPTSSDPKSQGDDHLRLLKNTIKTTFPAVTGAVTPTHTELNYVDGVTSAIQTQLDLKAPLASPVLTGTPEAPTATLGNSTTQIATTEFVALTSLTASLPGQTGKDGFILGTDGTVADWTDEIDLDIIVPAVGTKIATTTGTETLTDKTATDLVLADDADTTKKANFVLSGITAGQNRTLTVEDRNTLVMTPGWVLLSEVTASGSATADLETTIDSTYTTYCVVFDGIKPATNSTSLYVRLKIAGSYHNGASDYIWNLDSITSLSSITSNFSGQAQIDIITSNYTLSDRFVAGKLFLFSPSNTAFKKMIRWDAMTYQDIFGTDNILNVQGCGVDISSNAAVTGVRFLFSSGNIAVGTFKLFGIRGA